MKKTILLFLTTLIISYSFAQDQSQSSLSSKSKIALQHRPGDHFMLQLSSDHWTGMPDSISSHQSGFSRGFSAYFMLDKPFRTSPKYSIGIGVGISTSNIVFKKMLIGLNSGNSVLPFQAADSSMHFKKYKLATSFLEIPLEFRYTAKPNNYNKSLKAAIGLKIGTLVNAHTKGKTPQDKNNSTIGAYTEKINSKRFINGTRFMATARVGYGVFSLFGTYGLSPILKDGTGASMKLYQIGLTISGL